MIMIGDDIALAQLRSELTTVRQAQWRRLYEQCAWYREQVPPAEHPTASITYFGPAAANLALAFRLTGQRHYLEEAWRWISTCIGYPHWGKAKLPDHDLDAGWLLHGLSLALDWLGDDLGTDRQELLRAKLSLQGQRMYDYATGTEGGWWSSSYWQNHNWICYAGLATAGQVLGCQEWVDRARMNFDTVLPLLATDGSDCEGVVYWRYGVPWLAIYIDLVERTTGENLWQECPFLGNAITWRLHQSTPGFEEHLGLGDCHDRRSGHSVALYHRLAAAYRDGRAAWLADLVAGKPFWREAYASGVKPGVMAEAFLELLWYDRSVRPRPPDDVPVTAHFPDLGQVVTRTSWTDPDATVVSFTSAPGGGNGAWDAAERFRQERGWDTLNAGHHHPDAGAFLLTGHGAQLVVDDGYANNKRAAHHNLVLVDGQGWSGEDRYHVYKELPYTSRPELIDVLAEQGFVHATSRTAMMFDATLGVRRLDRTLVVTPYGRVVVVDRCEAGSPRRWSWLLHSDWPAEVWDEEHPGRSPGGSVVLRSGPGQAWVTRLPGTPAQLELGTTEVQANPTSSTPSLRISRTLQTATWRTEPVEVARFETVLETTSALMPSPSSLRRAGEGWFDLGDEWVAIGESGQLPAASPVQGRAAAAIGCGDRLALVAATEVRLPGGGVRSWAEPFTGVSPLSP